MVKIEVISRFKQIQISNKMTDLKKVFFARYRRLVGKIKIQLQRIYILAKFIFLKLVAEACDG